MPVPRSIDLDPEDMDAVWTEVGRIVRRYRKDVAELRVAPELDPGHLRRAIYDIDLNPGQPWRDLLAWVDRHMLDHQVHSAHPRYLGLFNPNPLPLGIAADALTAAYNPQLAAWSHSPFAVELERHLIHQFAARFGYSSADADGTFCTGGAEANHTALLCAVTTRFPEFAAGGARALPGQPTIYVSPNAHHSWVKAARASGLGTDAIRTVPSDAANRLDIAALAALLQEDRRAGYFPALVCATAGTTNAGIIDPLRSAAEVAASATAWFHVDAAWGGAARFVPEYRHWLDGIELADSITFDAHKFLSIPMGAGVFLTRHSGALHQTFRISADYMPRDAGDLAVTDPYTHSIQWSRRFIGLKVFLPLAAAGWDGVADTIRYQCRLGDRLRALLAGDGWDLVNDTPLPVVCFRDAADPEGAHVEAIARHVVHSGRAWISPVSIPQPALRACITNYQTSEEDLDQLLAVLSEARSVKG